tara:strand:- start:29019 stop:30062 length:1044 start_codon:yes stop_codon:yes gene_type:complete
VDALVDEILFYRETDYSAPIYNTLYIGGGTPSLLNETQLNAIFSALHHVFKLELDEVTMELNPDDVTSSYLKLLQKIGINRVSMGVQSFQPELLAFMHRAHSREEALLALQTIRDTGFPTFTADLIYGNPGQSLKMLEDDIETLLSFDPPHISAYSLTIEPETRLGKQVKLGRIQPPDDDHVSDHIDLVTSLFSEAGLHRYEVSNYAKPGKEALHNSNYWNHHNYLGFGPSAHSFWKDKKQARRWNNQPDLKYYLSEKPKAYRIEEEELDASVLAEERIMLGLRTKWGVSFPELENEYNYQLSNDQKGWIEKQKNEKLLTFENGILKLTDSGLKISDLLTVDILSKK